MESIENALYRIYGWSISCRRPVEDGRRGMTKETICIEEPNSTLVHKKCYDSRDYWSVLRRSYTYLSILSMNMLILITEVLLIRVWRAIRSMKWSLFDVFCTFSRRLVWVAKSPRHVHYPCTKRVTFATLSATIATEGTPFGTPFWDGVPSPTA